MNCVLLATEAAAGVGDTQPGAKGEGEEVKGEVEGEKEEENEQEKEEKAMRSWQGRESFIFHPLAKIYGFSGLKWMAFMSRSISAVSREISVLVGNPVENMIQVHLSFNI